MDIKSKNRWLWMVSLMIVFISITTPSYGNSMIKAIQKIGLIIAGIFLLIFLYQNIKMESSLRKKGLALVILFLGFATVLVPSDSTESIKMARNISWAVNCILIVVFLFYNRHNKVLVRRAILSCVICAVMGGLIYLLKTRG